MWKSILIGTQLAEWTTKPHHAHVHKQQHNFLHWLQKTISRNWHSKSCRQEQLKQSNICERSVSSNSSVIRWRYSVLIRYLVIAEVSNPKWYLLPGRVYLQSLTKGTQHQQSCDFINISTFPESTRMTKQEISRHSNDNHITLLDSLENFSLIFHFCAFQRSCLGTNFEFN